MDYGQLTLNFDRYQIADPTCIVARMLSVLDAAHYGLDREAGPFSVHELTIAVALAEIEALRIQA